MQWVCDFNTCPARLHTVSIKGTELPRHGATKSSVSSSMRAACSKLYAPARGCKPPCIFFFCSSFASISLLSGHALFRSYSWFVDLSLRQGCSTSKLSPFFLPLSPPYCWPSRGHAHPHFLRRQRIAGRVHVPAAPPPAGAGSAAGSDVRRGVEQPREDQGARVRCRRPRRWHTVCIYRGSVLRGSCTCMPARDITFRALAVEVKQCLLMFSVSRACVLAAYWAPRPLLAEPALRCSTRRETEKKHATTLHALLTNEMRWRWHPAAKSLKLLASAGSAPCPRERNHDAQSCVMR